jgi:hypothetical protein
LPLSLSFDGVPLFDMASPGCGVVVVDDDVLPGVMLPLDELLLPDAEGDEDDAPVPDDDVLPLDGVEDELDDDGDEELLVAGLVVDGLIVPVLLLDDDGDVLAGEVLLDDELVDGVDAGDELLSRWQPATPMAAATASTAQGFGFMWILRIGCGADGELPHWVSRIDAMRAASGPGRAPYAQPVANARHSTSGPACVSKAGQRGGSDHAGARVPSFKSP